MMLPWALLRQALAYVLIGYYRREWSEQTIKLVLYFRYVDDIFAIFNEKSDSDS